MFNKPSRPVIVSLRIKDAHPKALVSEPAHHNGHIHIKTGNFLLRSLVPSDVTSRFVEWLNDWQMLQGLNIGRLSFTEETLADFIASFDNHHGYFIGIFDCHTDLLLGFYTIDVNRKHKTGNLTTGVGEMETGGKPVLWATIDALLDHFYAEQDIEKFSARILARNHRMLFNFRNNTRFVLEAHLKQECLGANGNRVDIISFASFKNDILPVKPV